MNSALIVLHAYIREDDTPHVEEMLRQQEADPHEFLEGADAFHRAAMHNSKGCMEVLLRVPQPNPNQFSVDFESPLQVARRCRAADCEQMLMRHPRIVFPPGDIYDLHLREIAGNPGPVSRIRARVYAGIEAQRADEMAAAIEEMPGVLCLPPYPLHVCVIKGFNAGVESILNTYDVDVERVDASGLTAMGVAALHGNNDAVRLLLLRGGSVDTPVGSRFTANDVLAENKFI